MALTRLPPVLPFSQLEEYLHYGNFPTRNVRLSFDFWKVSESDRAFGGGVRGREPAAGSVQRGPLTVSSHIQALVKY